MALSVRSGQRTPSALTDETADLLVDCDECHTTALVRFPDEPLVQELAVQWALISPKLAELIRKIEKKNEQGSTTDEDVGSVAVVYDLLTTRRMTFTINGLFF
jgi:hypothetical protein